MKRNKRNRKQKRRPVITGIGIVSPVGEGKAEFFANLLVGKSGLSRISLFDAADYPCSVAAEVKNFRAHEYLSRRQRKYLSRGGQFACAATRMALDDALLDRIDPSRTDVILGAGVCSLDTVEEQVFRGATLCQEYDGAMQPYAMNQTFSNGPACAIALMAGARGYVTTVSSACTGGLNAMHLAARQIKDGLADIVLTGAVDTPITRYILQAYCAAKITTTERNDPERALRPFDRLRTGTALGEGSAVFVLEDYQHAKARGARIYGEIVSYAQQTENMNELFLDDKSGLRWGETIKKAVGQKKIDFVSAHGSGTVFLDKAENRAIRTAFGEQAGRIPVSSMKGSVGCGLASAGAFQLAATAMTLFENHIPPSSNYEFPDPHCDLNYVRTAQREANLEYALVNSHGLGGMNAAMVLQKAS